MSNLELSFLIQSVTMKNVIISGRNNFFIIKINFGQFRIGSSIKIKIVNNNNKLKIFNIIVILAL